MLQYQRQTESLVSFIVVHIKLRKHLNFSGFCCRNKKAKYGPILRLHPKELNKCNEGQSVDSQPLSLMPFSGSLLKHFTLPITYFVQDLREGQRGGHMYYLEITDHFRRQSLHGKSYIKLVLSSRFAFCPLFLSCPRQCRAWLITQRTAVLFLKQRTWRIVHS